MVHLHMSQAMIKREVLLRWKLLLMVKTIYLAVSGK